MINVYVQHETARSEELGERIHNLLTQAMPAVEKVTGLAMPDRVTVELVDVEGLAIAWSAFTRRQAERDTAGLDLTAWQRRMVASLPVSARYAAIKVGMSEEYTLIANSAGRPSTLIVPEALDRLRLDGSDQLCELLVRALAQQAQVAACEGSIVPAPVWPLVRASRDVATLLSHGHAEWTSRQATPLILSKAVDRNRRRRQGNCLEMVIGLAEVGLTRHQARATALVDQAMAAVGPDRFNHVWSVAGLLPTFDEMRHPARWIKRLPA
ncbi:zinc-dependent metalloprotease [Streptomyces sp. NPDC001709]